MMRWWCMDCRNTVETDQHGRCGTCESEAVILAEPENGLNGSVPVVNMDSSATLASA
jgi:Zn finger protein HypA/HybF involved in hydrogenase expression